MEDLRVSIGRVLRRARRSRGLTLREVEALSRGLFKPTSVAGYERGERSISLERFVLLAEVYGVSPERLLGEIRRIVARRPPSIVRPDDLDALTDPERSVVAGFLEKIRVLRGQREEPETIGIRAADLEVLAATAGERKDEFLQRISSVLIGMEP